MSEKEKCPEFEYYLKLARKILDRGANYEEENNFWLHINGCDCCKKEFILEKQIRNKIKDDLSERDVPRGLANIIKAKILQSGLNDR